MNEAAKRVLPANVQTDNSGQALFEFMISVERHLLCISVGLGLHHLVLAAQFESFVDPFVIMLTVPLSMTGALLALQFTGNKLALLLRVASYVRWKRITKHGILLVEGFDNLRDQAEAFTMR